MDELQDLPELPTKKPRQELDVGLEKGPRGGGVTDGNSPSDAGNPAVLGSDLNPFPPPTGAQLEGSRRSEAGTEAQPCNETSDSFTHPAVTCKGLTTTSSDYSTQLCQGTRSLGHVLSPRPFRQSPRTRASRPSPAGPVHHLQRLSPASQGYGLPPSVCDPPTTSPRSPTNDITASAVSGRL
ncbi:hypothetical protein ANANG_G00183090 [Anguilla anguilla]|uniref:Uncharacterized protein n=1 Tax=Anguilla anguilla TaxID=7936 RepID=A0A9D3RU05_ANGAN|nr:hypothetical protein ANANG_G00183090 [Anguilla anguilla]